MALLKMWLLLSSQLGLWLVRFSGALSNILMCPHPNAHPHPMYIPHPDPLRTASGPMAAAGAVAHRGGIRKREEGSLHKVLPIPKLQEEGSKQTDHGETENHRNGQ